MEEKKCQDNSDETLERRRIILDTCKDESKNEMVSYFLSLMVLQDSLPILRKKGKKCNVTSTLQQHENLGSCYGNSVGMIRKGYQYVEGVVTHKETGDRFSHSWNVDKDGNHVDFTFKDPENFKYFGVIIPNDIVYDIGGENGIWYCVLPFIDDL